MRARTRRLQLLLCVGGEAGRGEGRGDIPEGESLEQESH